MMIYKQCSICNASNASIGGVGHRAAWHGVVRHCSVLFAYVRRCSEFQVPVHPPKPLRNSETLKIYSHPSGQCRMPVESIGEAIGIISGGFCLIVVELYTSDFLAFFLSRNVTWPTWLKKVTVTYIVDGEWPTARFELAAVRRLDLDSTESESDALSSWARQAHWQAGSGSSSAWDPWKASSW